MGRVIESGRAARGLLALLSACGTAVGADVLLLGDGGSETQVQSALEAAGHLVTFAGPYSTWDGSGLGSVDTVIYLDGVNYGLGLTPAADAALAAFVTSGGRLVMTEWTAYDEFQNHVGPQVSQLMAINSPTGAFGSNTTWTVALPNHPLAAGLPSSWSDAAGFSSFVVAHPNATVVITGNSGYPMLAYRADVGGAVVHVNHDMTYTTPTIDPNALQILVNAVEAAILTDCNGNGVADVADINGGAPDGNANGIPDECEFSGTIAGAQVWTSGRTVYVNGDLQITGSLTVEAGVQVVPAAGVAILVQAPGALLINGTAAEPVTMVPAAGIGRWDGIMFSGGSGEIFHAILERLTTSGISITGSSPTIDSCAIRDVLPASGSAYGIKVAGSSFPVISNTLIRNVAGADGADGSYGADGANGSNGGNGAGGQACFGGGFNGANGGAGALGGAGTAGANGGDAFGVQVSAGGAHLVGCRIIDLQGGQGGQGGGGGNGGYGGSGGDGPGGVFGGGNGGYGGSSGNGRQGATGGQGGRAIGVELNQSAGSVVAQNIIAHLTGGNGEKGGMGGLGGDGGSGGDGADNLISYGCGGNGGDAGSGGPGGTGGRGGDAISIAVYNYASAGTPTIAQNTVAAIKRGAPGLGGFGGFPGYFGLKGLNGDGSSACTFKPCCTFHGEEGNYGADGAVGPLGAAIAVHASTVSAGPSILVRNNIVVPGNASYSVGLRAESNASIDSDWNCLWDYGTQYLGGVVAGAHTIIANPLFLDPDGADNVLGTEDDDLRLSSGSPCIDAASNQAVPQDVADLDGDGNTAEALPLDADGNVRLTGPSVDIGAYEFGSGPPAQCPADVNGNGTVEVTDLLSMLGAWGTNPGGPPDLDGDGVVNVTDLLALLAAWGPCP